MSRTDHHQARPRPWRRWDRQQTALQRQKLVIEQIEKSLDLPAITTPEPEECELLGMDEGEREGERLVYVTVGEHPYNEDDAHLAECVDCCHEFAYHRSLALEDEAEGLFNDDDDDDEPWMPTLSIAEVYQTFGEDFLIEGPSIRRESKMEHYYRAHELARLRGVSSAALIRELRLSGEYVATAQSLVACPVGDNLIGQDNHTYGTEEVHHV